LIGSHGVVTLARNSEVDMLRKTQWTPEERSKLRPTDSRCYEAELGRYVVHRKDGDLTNNEVSNLVFVDLGPSDPNKPKIDWLSINRECSE